MRFSIRGLFVVTAYAAVFAAAVSRASFVSFWAAYIAAFSLVVIAARMGARLHGPSKSYSFAFSTIAALGLIRTILLQMPFLGGSLMTKLISVGGPFSPTAAAFIGVMSILNGLCLAIIVASLAAAIHHVTSVLRK
jgi:hypothetical protein